MTVVRGIPVTTVARTLFDLSAVIRPDRLARSVDTALAQRMVTLMDLSRIARDLGVRGRRCSSVIRQILEARGDDFVAPETEIEQEFVDLVAGSSLPQPDRQVTLGDSEGVIGRVDLLYRRERVVIETDGREHHTSLLDRQSDAERDRRLRAAGWTVIRLTWFDVVHDRARTLRRIRAALTTEAWSAAHRPTLVTNLTPWHHFAHQSPGEPREPSAGRRRVRRPWRSGGR